MSEMLSIEQLLDGANKPAPKSDTPQEAVAAPPAGETPKPPLDAGKPAEGAQPPEKGEGAPPEQTGEKKDGVPPAPAESEDAKQTRAFKTAAEDERRKRQDLERHLSEVRAQNAELLAHVQRGQQQQPQNQQPQPQIIDEALAGIFQQARQQDREEIGRELYRTRVETSQFLMRQRHDDYDEVEKVFADEANRNPALWNELAQHPIPAAFAYEQGRKVRAMQEIGQDPVAYRAKLSDELRESIKAEVLAELARGGQAPANGQQSTSQTQPQTAAPAPAPPPSLAGMTSQTRPQGPVWEGPTSLETLLSQPIRRTRLNPNG